MTFTLNGWTRAERGGTPKCAWRRAFAIACCALSSVFVNGGATAQVALQLDNDGEPSERLVLICTRVTDAADSYVNSIDPRVFRVPILSASTIDDNDDMIPDWETIAANLDNECTPGYNGVICLDWERDFFEALKTGPEHPMFDQAIDSGVGLVNFIKEKRPNAKVGYYAFPPEKWKTEISDLQPLIDAVDVFMPAGAIGTSDNYDKKLIRFHKNVKHALELSNGRPVVPFHCPRMTHEGNKLLDMELFESHMEKSFDVEVDGRRAAGIIIWDNTIRLFYQNELDLIDWEYIPSGMELEAYATQLQRHYICRAARAVLPGYACNELMPGESQNGMIAGGPELPDINDDESGWSGGEPGVQQRRHIIQLDDAEATDGSVAGSFGFGSKQMLADGVPSGVNLASLNPYVSGWAFTNLLWVSSPWSLLDSQGNEVAAGAQTSGYPLPANGQTAHTVIGEDLKNILPPGKWLTLFEGQGTIEMTGDASTIRKSQGRVLFRVTPSDQGVVMNLSNVPANDPLRNLRVLPVSALHTADAPTLHSNLTGRLKDAKPMVVRFASWQMIDGSPVVAWADRAKLSDVSQVTERGAAIELMIQLCNEIGADAWFCMPHLASDDFVQQFAALVSAKLHPARKVYIEHSSDVMNAALPQFNDVAELGGADQFGATPEAAAALQHVRRSGEIFAMWREAFSAQPARVVCVLSVPGHSSDAAALVLGHDTAVASADAIAIAGGFGGYAMAHDLAAISSGLSVDGIVSMLTQSKADLMPSFESVAALVRSTSKPMLVSMAGAGLLVHAGSFDRELITLLHKVESDPRTVALTDEEKAFWEEQGAVLILADDRPAGAP